MTQEKLLWETDVWESCVRENSKFVHRTAPRTNSEFGHVGPEVKIVILIPRLGAYKVLTLRDLKTTLNQDLDRFHIRMYNYNILPKNLRRVRSNTIEDLDVSTIFKLRCSNRHSSRFQAGKRPFPLDGNGTEDSWALYTFRDSITRRCFDWLIQRQFSFDVLHRVCH